MSDEQPLLLPCPHCGGTTIDGPDVMNRDAYGSMDVWIECEDCAAQFVFNVGDEAIGKAMCIRAWNRRTLSADLARSQSRCDEAVNALRKYGVHEEHCYVNGTSLPESNCDCGLAAALNTEGKSDVPSRT